MSLIPTREDRAYSDGYLEASENRSKMIDYLAMQLREAQELIGVLTAERDAAARDMRERCAKVAAEMTEKWGDPNGNGYQQGVQDQGIRIIHQICALPLVVMGEDRK